MKNMNSIKGSLKIATSTLAKFGIVPAVKPEEVICYDDYLKRVKHSWRGIDNIWRRYCDIENRYLVNLVRFIHRQMWIAYWSDSPSRYLMYKTAYAAAAKESDKRELTPELGDGSLEHLHVNMRLVERGWGGAGCCRAPILQVRHSMIVVHLSGPVFNPCNQKISKQMTRGFCVLHGCHVKGCLFSASDGYSCPLHRGEEHNDANWDNLCIPGIDGF